MSAWRGDLDGLGDRSEFQQNLPLFTADQRAEQSGERLAAEPCISAVTECSPTADERYIKFASFVGQRLAQSCSPCAPRARPPGHYGARGILQPATMVPVDTCPDRTDAK